MKYHSNNIDEIALKIIDLMARYKFFLLTGSLGAGKTTLIKNVFNKIGVSGIVMSPTFSYVIKYQDKDQNNLYHFDLYRLKTVNSFLEMGLHDLLNPIEGFYFIEWPEIIESLLPKDLVCRINIDYIDEENRQFLISFNN